MTLPCDCIDVAVALPIHTTFTYSVPERLAPLISVGKRVLVPFGRRRVTGYILGCCRDDYQKEIKNVLDILDETPLFPSSMLPFFRWVAEYYMHPIGDVIKSALPGGLNLYDFVSVSLTDKGEQFFSEKSLTPLENSILEALKKNPCRFKDLGNTLNKKIPYALIYDMEQRGLIASQRKFKGGTTKPKTERYVSLCTSDVSLKKVSAAKQKIIDAISVQGDISVRNLKTLVPSASKAITSLAKDGYISILNKTMYRDPFGEPICPDTPHVLTDEQKQVISKVGGFLGKGYTTCLLACP